MHRAVNCSGRYIFPLKTKFLNMKHGDGNMGVARAAGGY